MAIRIRSRFHAAARERSAVELASVVATLAWKLAVDSIKRMREARFDIDLGRAYFDFVCESLAFYAHVADRVAYRELEPAQRAEFTRALALRLADVVEENADMLLAAPVPGRCRGHFLDLFNAAGGEYGEFGYAADGPDFGFRRAFAARVRAGMPDKDRAWIYDQVMEIEAPEGVRAIEKTLAGLFAKDDPQRSSRRSRPALTGE